MTNEQLLREACRVIWSEGDLSRVPEFYASDFKAHYSPDMASWTGLEGVVKVVNLMKTAFPDYNETIIETFEQGDRIATRFVARGTHTGNFAEMPPTGKSIEYTEVALIRVADGKLAEQWGVFNFSVLIQLGLMEAPELL